MPAGISFYTFQTLSFSIDSYRRKLKIMPSFLDYILFVCYFPQLVAGPILRPNNFFDIDSKPIINFRNYFISAGFSRICYGLFLKLCLADELARLNDIAYSSNFNLLSFIDAWTMAFGFGLQIYFDFSSYSHMAIGISKILGLTVPENFMFPYNSTSVAIFWRRWHISLSSWISDYLYSYLKLRLSPIFLGFSPLLVTWLIMGIWHGSSFRFAIWGFLNGLLILIYRIIKKIDSNKLFQNKKLGFFNWIITLFAIMSTWIYFRSNSIEQANKLFSTLFNLNNFDLSFRENYYLIVALFSLITFSSGLIWDKYKFSKIVNYKIIKIFACSLSLFMATLFINRQVSFIYFQF